eukprot:TRINITY_DN34497_c0_g1_i1.p1 TRINITY_DN34497_c0_g1~~TRINITY_DN34497_c0_g1_i1.p1  ORF type:complete len:658 (-),score=143.06 TRINITY_DN34497_c0_g1_i1:443-2320(-)
MGVLSVAAAGLLLTSAFARLQPGANPPVNPTSYDTYVVSRNPWAVRKVARLPKGALGWAKWNDDVDATGWSYLSLTTSFEHPDADQAYGAGFLEGYVSHKRIWDFWYNSEVNNSDPAAPYDNATVTFIETNNRWINQQIALYNSTDPYWHGLHMIFLQIQGLVDGYNAGRDTSTGEGVLTMEDMMRSNYDQGDVYDIQCLANISMCADSHPAFLRNVHKLRREVAAAHARGEHFDKHPFSLDSPDVTKLRQEMGLHRNRHVFKAARGHCTSMVKVAPGNADLFAGHTTWDDMSQMTRIWKVYKLGIRLDPRNTSWAAPRYATVSMSSYPLSLASTDDFVLNSNGIVALSSQIFPPCPNADVWKNIQPRGLVWEYLRNIYVMRVADTAPNWARTFGLHQSSTYNNEWLVVDYKQFTPGQPLREDTVWLIDQMPNEYTAYDLTPNITQSTWFGSWNTQGDPQQYAKCGWPEFVQELKDTDGEDVANDYSHCCQTRAKLMGRIQKTVTSLEEFGNLMRRNNYKEDPESLCNCTALPYTACKAVATRCDLMPLDGMGPESFFGGACFGGYDSKVTSSGLARRLGAWAQSAPPYDDVPVFEFSKAPTCADTGIRGLPDRWDMPWVTVYPF